MKEIASMIDVWPAKLMQIDLDPAYGSSETGILWTEI